MYILLTAYHLADSFGRFDFENISYDAAHGDGEFKSKSLDSESRNQFHNTTNHKNTTERNFHNSNI